MADMHIGKLIKSGKVTSEKYYLNSQDLTTHVFICGSTGSGKTVLGKGIIEEAVKKSIPCVIIDLKGDLSSLKVPLFDLTENEISDFIEGYTNSEQKENVKKNIAEFKNALSLCDLKIKDIQDFRNNANIRIFTPKSRICDQFSISFIASPPHDIIQQLQNEPELILNQIANQASNIIKRLFGEEAARNLHEEKNLIEAAILYLYKNNTQVEGKAGVIALIKTIYDTPFDRIGMLKVKEFISDEKKMALIRRLNTLLVGAESLWYEGESIDSIINSLVNLSRKPDDKTNVYIFNLSFLENFDDRNLILSNIAMTLFNYMKRLGDSREPRALFYIDEIGGGKLSFFPDDPIQNESKSAINLLLRQGRAFGLCCVLSTQNPGDIDYRGLTNCHTWYIGKLLTKADRDKVMQGISASPYFLESFDNFLKSASGGDFIAKTKSGNVVSFHERWLLTFHKVLTYDDFYMLKKNLYATDDFLIGTNYLAKKEYSKAVSTFEKILRQTPDSVKAIGLLGEAYFYDNSFKESMQCFEKILKAQSAEYSMARAYYFMGEIANKGGFLDKASELYSRSVKTDPEFADSYYKISEIKHKLNKYNEALQNIQRFIVLRSNSDSGYYLMASIYYSANDFIAAEKEVKKAYSIALTPELKYNAKLLESKIKYSMGQYAHSLEIIDEARKLADNCGFDHTDCDLLSASIFAKFKENEKAVICLEKVISHKPLEPQAIVQLAELYYKTQNNFKLNETINRLEKIRPDDINIYNYRARILLKEKKFKEAAETLDKTPETSGSSDIIETVRGLIYEEQGDNASAARSYQKAAEINPKAEEAIYNMSRIHFINNDFEAQKKLLLALLEFASDEKYYYDLGLCYEKLNQTEPAVKAFENLYLMSYENPEINLKKAQWYKKLKNTIKAIESIDKFVKARPDLPDGYITKGEIFTVDRKYEQALEFYDMAERKAPGERKKIMLSRAFTYEEMGDSQKAEDCRSMAMEL